MESVNSGLHQQIPTPYRQLQPQAEQALQHGQPHLSHHTLASQQGLDLSGLVQDDNNSVYPDLRSLQDPNTGHSVVHQYPSPIPFDRNNAHQQMHVQNTGSPHTPQQQHPGQGQFGILTAGPPLHHNPIGRLQQTLQQDDDLFGTPDESDQKSTGHHSHKIIPNPPNLEAWREKLFNVDEMITLSEEEYNTYFPHVDNVYSHRSTQKYKRKPFVSHYWDCRLKGRPPGTAKSDDPNKKKRKRTARERDLCDVKIKITEYFPGAMLRADFQPDGGPSGDPSQANNYFAQAGAHQQQFALPLNGIGIPPNHPGATGQRYYTIQRVNGNGGNGKGDGVAGPHKHDLKRSDEIKKNSIVRFLQKREKEDKKTQKTYHKRASGLALSTVKKHSKENDLKLFASCFCPFVQRVWIALEAKGIQYQYIEVDPYKKPQSLLEVNPRGLVPAIRHGDWGCGESTVLMEYLEDLQIGPPLLPQDAQAKAHCRLWSDHIDRKIVPAFYQLLQNQDFNKQAESTRKLRDEISQIVDVCDPQGPFFLGSTLSYTDVHFAPWILRCSRVLKHYRGWQDPQPGSRWAIWFDAIENNEFVKATTSMDELYIDSYERYAMNRPNTSELADAVNGGYNLP
ncbi:hypothetical protein SS1G_06623 [Sclerotinia sclerotiorum 1980 UF-70]|uniref:GST N-terminal domain-containing protein n=2 Tax=Sclerotinia sclerotiorum (strain ATCC 18683 / 1980 / Ss-1) TaxID=665079 RepID=A7EMS4_SCLS1|nr:hypothetical protein SS1G_06623 [Sclerotinia sclerotiorum 1980 UF-70]APA14640.1 hypothetical protein sscle_13g094100 [Sclerotinia sclerotiorum 1980 UF-70]EDO04140.1 hypothetical protein SS1G_06623 [Sclerotinia sclerotiorum 1980 UF-70]